MTNMTQHIMNEMDLYGSYVSDGERDTRPAPDVEEMGFAALEMLEIASGVLAETCFEDETQKLLYSLVYVWHRRSHDLNRELDRVELEINGLVREQDGSEIKDLQLQKATEKAHTLQAKVALFDQICDQASVYYEKITGFAWVPSAGSKIGFDGSASILSAVDFQKARKEHKKQALKNPDAPVIVFSGGQQYEDIDKIFRILDNQKKNTPDMILATSAQLKGADTIAMSWARSRKVSVVKCLPNKQHGKRAGFVRNQEMLKLGNVIGVIVVKGSGVQAALVRDARDAGLKYKTIGFEGVGV